MAHVSYLVAAIGQKNAALIQCFAQNEAQAAKTIDTMFSSAYGEQADVTCIGAGAAVGTWIDGEPSYIQSVISLH